ncbi:hypothetical protein FFWV33_02410 [Flavobacterium faecale]|uniref:Uncharacterized protein n=1 Tax=Flavobacterium faecale TaxID=1355330 RepID=A0A2S1L9P8_9FLAO|nr:hypothetical protein [Flavobacterium faecale]AWG20461.1 hypothetical protein FFWV33_02410 [Flavobacterium faecale]
MDLKLPTSEIIITNDTNSDPAGYYLVSTRWTMINDKSITFVRSKSLGYCYNLKWAGPMNKFDAEKANQSNKTTRIVSHCILKPFIAFLNNEMVLPNSPEVRKLIGLDSGELQLAN